MQSSGEAWRSTRSAGCRCSPRPPGTRGTSRSEAREGTRRPLRPRRRLTPTSPSPSQAGPLLPPPPELGRAPPRCCSTTHWITQGVRGQGEDMRLMVKVLGEVRQKRYKTKPLFFFFYYYYFLSRIIEMWRLFCEKSAHAQ